LAEQALKKKAGFAIVFCNLKMTEKSPDGWMVT
jgi:hypothetical protein